MGNFNLEDKHSKSYHIVFLKVAVIQNSIQHVIVICTDVACKIKWFRMYISLSFVHIHVLHVLWLQEIYNKNISL